MKSFEGSEVLQVPGLDGYLAQVQQTLELAVAGTIETLRHPALRLLKAPSKRLRSSLVIAITLSQNGCIDKRVLHACAAIELVHIASLIHDDIIDEADTRWNIPTISAFEGRNEAILVGDYLFGLANYQASFVGPTASRRVAEAIIAICAGESRELADEFNTDRSLDSVRHTMRDKTGALLAVACQMGGICAKLPISKIHALEAYGHAFGISFQLVDDILDLVSNSKLSGKPVGNDIMEGVYTLPVVLALQRSSAVATRNYLKHPSRAHHAALITQLLEDGSLKESVIEAGVYAQRAAGALEGFSGSRKAVTSLARLPERYMTWALTQQVAPEHQTAIAKFLR